jgi:hypothetical protein
LNRVLMVGNNGAIKQLAQQFGAVCNGRM